MLTMLLLATAAGQSSQAEPTGAQVLSNTLKHYYSAVKLEGTITTSVEVGNTVGVVRTTFQIQRPNLLYIKQESKSLKKPFQAVSNGEYFAYPHPKYGQPLHRNAPEYVLEPVKMLNGQLMDVQAMYQVLKEILPDKSFALDMAVSNQADLSEMSLLMDSFNITGKEVVDGETVYTVSGKIRQAVGLAMSGTFAFKLGESGKLYSFKRVDTVSDSKSTMQVSITSIADIRTDNDAKINRDLFKKIQGAG